MPLAGKPLIAHACDRLQRQIGDIIINANGDPARFRFLGKPVQGDTVEGFAGPLAGILAAMEWTAENRPWVKRIVTVPADTPFFPDDLVVQFTDALGTVDTHDHATVPFALLTATATAIRFSDHGQLPWQET